MQVSLILAVSENNVIGKDGALPWRLSSDLRWFKSTTMGHHIIMGRKTYDSIGKPLPGRTTIVVTRDGTFTAPGCQVTHSLDEALSLAQNTGETEAFIVGGAQLYTAAWSKAHRLYLTEVHATVEGDTYLQNCRPTASEWQEVHRDEHPASDRDEYPHALVIYDRKA